VQTSELNYFKDILLSRKKQIIKNIDGVNSELSQLSGLELNDEGDHASANSNSMVESAIAQQQAKELAEIEIALGKIAHGGYGICDMCEDDIGFQRLKVKPHATYCIDCREIVEKTK
jgi:DnaK suppressor protein